MINLLLKLEVYIMNKESNVLNIISKSFYITTYIFWIFLFFFPFLIKEKEKSINILQVPKYIK